MISTKQRHAVQHDPAVMEAISLFGGEVVDIRQDISAPLPTTDEEDDNTDD